MPHTERSDPDRVGLRREWFATSAFSGLVSSAWALAGAAASAPMVSLDRCMAPLPTGEEIKADRP